MISELLRTFLAWFLIFPAIFLTGSRFKPMVQIENIMLRGVLYCAIGMACLSYGVVLLSAGHLLSSASIWAFLIILIVTQFKDFKTLWDWFSALYDSVKMKEGVGLKILVSIFIISSLALLMGVLSPEIGGDALCYHLSIPKVFLVKGSIQPDYYDVNSYFPILMNNLYLVGLATGGVLAAKLFHWLSGFLLFLGLKTIIEQETNNSFISYFFALTFWLTPVIYNLLSTTYVDVALAFYVFVALYVFVQAFEHLNRNTFLLSGFLLGCAMSIKYLAALSVFGFLAVWVFKMIESHSAVKYSRSFIAWLAGFGLGCGYWLIRNWILVGNPVFPYLASLFGTEAFPGMRYESYGIGKGLWDFLSLSWTMFYFPTAFGSFGTRIGIFYFLFFPFMMLAVFIVPRARIYCVFTLAFLAAWFYTCQAHRYILPALPTSSLIGAFGFSWCCSFRSFGSNKILRLLVSGVGIISLAVYLLAGLFHYRYSYLLYAGKWSPDEYLRKMERTIPLARWINSTLSKDAKILLVGEPRRFYIDRAVIRDAFFRYRTHYDEKNLTSFGLKDFLKSKGITHVLLSDSMADDAVDLDGGNHSLRRLVESSYVQLVKRISSENIRDERYVYNLYELS